MRTANPYFDIALWGDNSGASLGQTYIGTLDFDWSPTDWVNVSDYRAGEFVSLGDNLDLWELVGSSWVKSHIPQAPRRSVIVRYMDQSGLPTTLAPPTVVVIDEPSKAVLPAESRLQQRIHCESPIEESDVALIAGDDAPVVDDGFASCGATCG